MYRYRITAVHPIQKSWENLVSNPGLLVGQVLESKERACIYEWTEKYFDLSGFCRGRIGNVVFTAIKVEDITDQEVEPDPWIPVSERLPKPKEDVLCWEKGGFYVLGTVAYDTDYDCYVCVTTEQPVGITHWMPLPPGPKTTKA